MKPLLSFCLLIVLQTAYTQTLDYISIRKKNGRTVKNFYTGTNILVQLKNGSYLQGPVQAVRNDSVFVTFYDIRYWPTAYGSYIKDTISTTHIGLHYKEIQRIYLNKRKSFISRRAGPLLMIGGAGHLVLNVLNGALFKQSITNKINLQRIGTATGAFGLGYLLNKLFASDGFHKKNHQIFYVDL